MKKQFALFAVTALFTTLMFTSSCKKEETNDDLTTQVVGKYSSGSGSSYTEIIVTKINNSTISVYIQDVSNSQTHAESKMNSKTSFTLNKVTETVSGKRYEYTGSGSASANNIVITRNEKEFDASNNNLISEDSYTYTGSK
jgi:hypothetical protein